MMSRKPKILVVGSFVMDLITSARVFPGSGETVLGETFRTAPGGKGANQAVQAARLGAEVTMVGKVGCDGFGDALIGSAEAAGIHTDHVCRDASVSSAIGNIILELDENGGSRNRIIVVPGANMTITPDDVAFLKDTIADYDMVILQFEIPMAINVLVAGWAREAGVPVMVNPAPAAPIPDELLRCADFFSPNEHEAAALTGVKIGTEGGVCMADLKEAAAILRGKGVRHLLVTLGENGAAICQEDGVELIPAVPDVRAIDPTAAGDSFVAAFCVGVCAGLSRSEAIDLARNTAAITVSRMGAQPSLPMLADVLEGMKEHAEKTFPYEKLDILK